MFRHALPAILLVLAILAGCRRPAPPPPEPSPRLKLIREIQQYGESVGFKETGSFSRHAPHQGAFYRCYYTGKLELPDSYAGLKLKDGTDEGCNVDEQKYDVFFYRIEAVASPDTPATAALDAASMERLAVVVSHEDFHQQKAIRRLPPTVEEASTTLVSFLTAAGYAKSAQGEDSALYRNLSGEADKFLQKAEIIKRFHGRLKSLYQNAAAGKTSKAQAVEEKARLFAELEQACKVTPDPVSFNECPAAMNNAGLAFDHSYTKHYPLMYRLAASHNQDVSSLWKTLQGLPAKKWSEAEAAAYLEGLIKR
ncbi:MAG: aminopeptidase [Bryobacterales bacterium]